MFKINIKPTNYSALLTAIIVLLAANLLYSFTRPAQAPAPATATAPAQLQEEAEQVSEVPVKIKKSRLFRHALRTTKDDSYFEAMRGYQIDLYDEGAAVWDGDRYVGFLPYNETCQFHKLMTNDNR